MHDITQLLAPMITAEITKQLTPVHQQMQQQQELLASVSSENAKAIQTAQSLQTEIARSTKQHDEQMRFLLTTIFHTKATSFRTQLSRHKWQWQETEKEAIHLEQHPCNDDMLDRHKRLRTMLEAERDTLLRELLQLRQEATQLEIHLGWLDDLQDF